MKNQGLFDLFTVESDMSMALYFMQQDIDDGRFLDAMASQFEYLYLFDKWESLLFKHSDEYFYLLNMAKGRA
jgi:hypothetical protein